jgi:hypothetical protein
LTISGTVIDAAGNPVAPNPQWASVVGRFTFYNDSAYDGGDPAADSADDNAIAQNPDGSPKAALLPGHNATFANYTSYTNGLNGINGVNGNGTNGTNQPFGQNGAGFGQGTMGQGTPVGGLR